MKKQHRQQIKTVDDFNDVVADLLDDWLLSFTHKSGLIREPDEDDYYSFDSEIGWIYTQKGMKLYDRACARLRKLGEKLFPNDEHNLDIKANGMLYP